MSGFSFKSLRFPENLGTTDVPNYIRFVPKVMKYGGTENLMQGTNGINPPANNPAYSRLNPSVSNITGQIAAGVGGIAQTAAGLTNAVSNTVNTLTSAPLSVKNVFGAAGNLIGRFADITGTTLDFGLKTLPDELKTAGSINLYLPQNLETNSSVDYETAALGGIGIQAVKTASNLDNISTLEALGNIGAGTMQDLISSGNRRAITGIATNRVTNNFSFQVFNSVLHRQFSYEFRMMPKNGNESAVIKDICDTFLFYMLPARDNSSNIGFYEVPCQWEIKYMRQGGPLEFHMQPKNCFLQSVDVAYGGETQNSTFNDGAPMEVVVRLQFVEIEPLYRTGSFDNKKAGDIFGNENSTSGSVGSNNTAAQPAGPGGNGGV